MSLPIPLPRSSCRICPGTLETVLDLGLLYVSAFPLPEEADGLAAPIDLCRCDRCGLVQLRHTVPGQYLYCTYWYRSGVNEVMRAELLDIVRQAAAWVDLQPGETVVDIGANDGTLLAQYAEIGIRPFRVAYEPAENLQPLLRAHTDAIAPTCFPAPGILSPAVAKIVTSIACYYDTEDPVRFAQAVAEILHPDGVWIIQAQDLQQMLDQGAWDNLCHEHLWQPCLAAVGRIVRQAGLGIIAAQRRAINGGSLRILVQHQAKLKGRTLAHGTTLDFLEGAEAECESTRSLAAFAHRVQTNRRKIWQVLEEEQEKGQIIDLYAASTKANTLLQACGLGREMIRQAWERSPEKWGRVTVGTRIPLVSEEAGRRDPPDVLFVGAWQFAQSFRVREAAFLQAGGRMIVPLPKVERITWTP